MKDDITKTIRHLIETKPNPSFSLDTTNLRWIMAALELLLLIQLSKKIGDD